MISRLFGALFLLLFPLFALKAVHIDVPPGENTLPVALRQARELRRLGQIAPDEPVELRLSDGEYRLTESLLVRPEDSGTALSPTRICAAVGTFPVVSGGISITDWQPFPKNRKLWSAPIPRGSGNRPLEFRQLWINGAKAIRARSPLARIIDWNPRNGTLTIPSVSLKTIEKSDRLELVQHQRWAVAFLRVKGIERTSPDQSRLTFHQPESRLQCEHPWPQPVVGEGKGNSPFYLVGALELLDEPGEWYADFHTERIYYYPRPTDDPQRMNAVVPVLERLVTIEGAVERPVQHIEWEGITFAHSSWLRPSLYGHVPLQGGFPLIDAYKLPIAGLPEKETLENQAWIVRPEAAVALSGTRYIRFVNCRFSHLASTALDLIHSVVSTSIEDCTFSDIAGNGLLFGAFPDGGFETHLPYDPLDPHALVRHTTVRSNLFTDCANEDWGCVGIAGGYVRHTLIEHNEVHTLPYSGICLGWGWTKRITCAFDNHIRRNLIYNFGIYNYDCGGIYTLSAQPGSSIVENYIHSIHPSTTATNDRAFYIYFDEATDGFEVRDNYTPESHFGFNTPGPTSVWMRNGPQVADSIRLRAGRILAQ